MSLISPAAEYNAAISLRQTRIYPLGCPVDLVTNDPALARAAFVLWPGQTGRFFVTPLSFEVRAVPGSSSSVQFKPEPNRFTFEAGRTAGGSFELNEQRGVIHTPHSSAHLLLESVILTALTWTHLLPIHAGCVLREGRSILLCGGSHAGKSTLTFACTRAGWTYVSDNSLYWEPQSNWLVSGSPVIRLREPARIMFGQSSPRIDPRARGFRCSAMALPGPSVFLSRRPGKAVLRPHNPEHVVSYFLSYATRPDRDVIQERYRVLAREGAWLLEYEHAEDAVECLNQMA